MITVIKISGILIMQICLLLSEEKIKTARSLLFAELAVEEIKIELAINEQYIQFKRSQMWVTGLRGRREGS